jgi:hypothetical protein
VAGSAERWIGWGKVETTMTHGTCAQESIGHWLTGGEDHRAIVCLSAIAVLAWRLPSAISTELLEA